MIRGQRGYLIDFAVQIHLGDERGTLVFKVVSKGEEIGKAVLEFSQMENPISCLGQRAFA